MLPSKDDSLASETLLITITYVGVLAIVASSLAEQWLAVASLISFYLIFLAPILMGVITYTNRAFRSKATHRRWVFYAGLLYFAIAPITGVLLVLFENYIQRA
jgi:predicted Na+-dependent transporter